MKQEGDVVPSVLFKTRVRDENVEGPNPYRWEVVASRDYFDNKRVIVFGLPGAFTPTCSTFQLPDFEELYPNFVRDGIDAIYCVSVNDAFVMNAWARDQELKNVTVIPDGSGVFTREMGMLVDKDNLGFGKRSWRYAMVVNNNVIEKMFCEEGKTDNLDDDPYEASKPQNILAYCSQVADQNEEDAA